ncbi:MAG: YkgJ family cysteine cluster protein [Nitrospirae bacterium]|nr:YkgJ family cysteine cluster protein [Nitrospirota bacterium]
MSKMNVIEPTRLDLGTKFRFRCHKGIKCFTKCCSNIDIMLTPYDIIRMKNKLGLSSEEFLEKYTFSTVDEESSHPYAYLKMDKDEKKSCPFVKAPDGCTIYTDRPVSCRYYPIGQATLKKQKDDSVVHEEFYFFVKEKHCLGYNEDTEWTVESWRDDQEANLYDDMNRGWKSILMRRNLPGQKELDPNKQEQFYIASYDLDRFRRYVFDSKFLDVFDINTEENEKIKSDEIALMKFGFRYLKYLFMMEKSLKIKPEAIGTKK